MWIGLLGQRLVGDRPLEVDDDRLGDADHGSVHRIERWRQEHRLTDVRRRVLPGGRALRDRLRLRNRRGGRRNGFGGGGGGGASANGSAGSVGGGSAGCRRQRLRRPRRAPVAAAAGDARRRWRRWRIGRRRRGHGRVDRRRRWRWRLGLGAAQTGYLAPVPRPVRPRRSRWPVCPSCAAAYITSISRLRPVWHNTAASYARETAPAPTTARPNGTELLCSSASGGECYFRPVAEGTPKSPRLTPTQISTTPHRVEAAISHPTRRLRRAGRPGRR